MCCVNWACTIYCQSCFCSHFQDGPKAAILVFLPKFLFPDNHIKTITAVKLKFVVYFGLLTAKASFSPQTDQPFKMATTHYHIGIFVFQNITSEPLQLNVPEILCMHVSCYCLGCFLPANRLHFHWAAILSFRNFHFSIKVKEPLQP